MTTADNAVEVRDLVKIYARPGGGTLRALDGVSFEVRNGEFFGFLGPTTSAVCAVLLRVLTYRSDSVS